MSTRQRGFFLGLAALVLAVAIAIALSGGSDEPASRITLDTTTTVAPTATTEPTPAEPVEPEEPAVPVLDSEDDRVEVSKGDEVRFVVRSDTADEVHLHGYDIAKDVEAGGEVEFTLKATITGIFEIELEGAGKPVGKLVVNP